LADDSTRRDGRPAGLLGVNLPPSPWVARFLSGAPAGREVLDLACGGGRHARLAARLGFGVVAVDRQPEIVAALADEPRISPMVFDLEVGAPWPFEPGRFGAVIVTNYLHRPLLADISAAISDDGVLIYETFAVGHERYRMPSNPDFLLKPNELLPPVLAAGLVVVGFEQGERPLGPDGRADGRDGGIVQRIAAVGPAHPWAFATPRSLDG
jgi:SAM-dependent methyltransferase